MPLSRSDSSYFLRTPPEDLNLAAAPPAGAQQASTPPDPARRLVGTTEPPELAPRPTLRLTRDTNPRDIADLDLAAYLLARKVTGRPVTPASKELLVLANQTKKDVLSLMARKHGSAPSGLSSAGDSLLNTGPPNRSASGGTDLPSGQSNIDFARRAGQRAFAGSGQHDDFANVAAHTHAKRLRKGESIALEAATYCEHDWAQVTGVSVDGQPPPSAIIDAFSDGPPVEPRDYRYLRESVVPTETKHRIDSRDASLAHRCFDKNMKDPGAEEWQRLRAEAKSAARADPSVAEQDEAPFPVVATAFAEAVRQALSDHPNAAQLREEAEAIARELNPALVGKDTPAAVDTVLALASNLDAPRPRPPEYVRPSLTRERFGPDPGAGEVKAPSRWRNMLDTVVGLTAIAGVGLAIANFFRRFRRPSNEAGGTSA